MAVGWGGLVGTIGLAASAGSPLWVRVLAVVAAFLASRIYGLDARAAAKLVGAVTFIAHGFGTVTESIWMMRPWSGSAKYLLDAALYAIGSGLVFLYLWP